MRYFARVTAGTEQIAWREISQLAGVQLLQTDHRRIDFDYADQPADLLALRSVDDVYAYVGKVQPIDHTRASLQNISQGITELDFAPALTICRTVRSVPPSLSYTVTASLIGGRNYTRYDAAEAVRVGLSAYRWHYVENAPDHVPVDVDIRILIEGDWLLVGIRLGEFPLHRRPYKLNSLPGSLKPPVAYCLCLLAEIQPNNVVLDPMCGAGTIPIEAAAFGAKTIIAADLNPQAALIAEGNIANAKINADVIVSDAGRLSFASDSIDRIVSNLPWGKQVAATADLAELYSRLISEFARVLRPNGRCVLLTDRSDLLLPALKASHMLRIFTSQQISLYGSHPTIYILTPTLH